MKVLRKQADETWEDVIRRRAKEEGCDPEDVEAIVDDYYDLQGSEADDAWEIAEYHGLLETIEAAEPGPDLEEAAA